MDLVAGSLWLGWTLGSSGSGLRVGCRSFFGGERAGRLPSGCPIPLITGTGCGVTVGISLSGSRTPTRNTGRPRKRGSIDSSIKRYNGTVRSTLSSSIRSSRSARRPAGMLKDMIASALVWAPTMVAAIPADAGMRYPRPSPSSGGRPSMLVGIWHVLPAPLDSIGRDWGVSISSTSTVSPTARP